MTLQELRSKILGILNAYIDDAKASKKSSFNFMHYLASRHSNVEQAKKLCRICEKNSVQEVFISELYDVCKTMRCSNTLLPKIVMSIVQSGLFQSASDRYRSIKENIRYANEHNDGSGGDSFEMRDYIGVLGAAIENSQAVEMHHRGCPH